MTENAANRLGHDPGHDKQGDVLSGTGPVPYTVPRGWTGGYWPRDREIPYPILMKKPTRYSSWREWPDDVRDLIKWFNQRGSGQWRLSFYPAPVFKCSGCGAFCLRSGLACHVYHKAHRRDAFLFCDDCMVGAARKALA